MRQVSEKDFQLCCKGLQLCSKAYNYVAWRENST